MSVHARVCMSVNVCIRRLGLHHCCLFHSLGGVPTPTLFTVGKQRPGQGSRAGLDRGLCPQVRGSQASASVLFLAHPAPIRTGSGLGSRGKGLSGRLPTHFFPRSWTQEQAEGRHEGERDDCGAGKSPAGWPWGQGETTADREAHKHPGMWSDPTNQLQGPQMKGLERMETGRSQAPSPCGIQT